LEKIATHNRKYDLGLVSFRMGVNKFSDLTFEEFSKFYTSKKIPKKTGKRNLHVPSNGPVANEVDWRNQGAVTEVKNQEQCGSCWAFSTTGSLEGQWFLSKGQLPRLSEQQLVDCSGNYGNNGCGGGLMDNAFAYIKDYGIMSENDYPYTAQDGYYCNYDSNRVVATLSTYYDVARGNEASLTDAIQRVGPISVGIDATQNFQYYSGGVFDDYSCQDSLNHGVLAVGFGSEGGNDYYIVKNSWGSGWGEYGYIRMSRNRGNQCGIASTASYPQV
jgi:cathepsin L